MTQRTSKLFILTFLIGYSLLSLPAASQEKKKILHLKVLDNIDPRTNRYTELGIERAKEWDADLIILELDTYGGALNDADDIRTRILDLTIPIYSFINKDAASAGALISIACDSIYMASASSIGAATVVGGDGAAAPDKYQSYMRSIMRSTAEAKGRNPKMAEAMVDEEIDLDSIATEGKVLTLSTSEALKWGFCEAQMESVEEILDRVGINEYEIEVFELGGSEQIISFFMNPFISGILIMVIIGGIYFELQTPGVGFPIGAAIIALIFYLTPYYLNGLAENWEIAMFFLGLVLIALEVFVLPGFGIAGVIGTACTFGALILVMLDNDFFNFDLVNTGEIFKASATTLGAMLGTVILMFVAGVRLTNSSVFNRVALQETQETDQGYTSTFYSSDLLGQEGTAFTILRPSGKIQIGGDVYDAFTRGDYISKDEKVIVISTEGTSLKVKKA